MRVVITGSSSGIGRAIAERLVAQGHSVWGLARRAQEPIPGGDFQSTACDVSDWSAVRFAAAEIGRVWGGRADALICCAGAQGAVGPTMMIEPEKWSQTVRLNLEGTHYSIAAFFSLVQGASRRGKILCFSGGGATAPRPNFSAYGVAKAGVVRLVETLAEEWVELMFPMDINSIAPGALPTKMTDEVLKYGSALVGPKEYAAARKTAAQGEAGYEKLFGLIDFLLSEKSDGITGRLLSAPWDPWPTLAERRDELAGSDIFTLRRIIPADRGKNWD